MWSFVFSCDVFFLSCSMLCSLKHGLWTFTNPCFATVVRWLPILSSDRTVLGQFTKTIPSNVLSCSFRVVWYAVVGWFWLLILSSDRTVLWQFTKTIQNDTCSFRVVSVIPNTAKRFVNLKSCQLNEKSVDFSQTGLVFSFPFSSPRCPQKNTYETTG